MNSSTKILSDAITYFKYAKYIPELKRREVWSEIVDRTVAMHVKKYPFLENEIRENFQYVYDKKVLPSMRGLQFAGPGVESNNARIFNCAYLPIIDLQAFKETAFLLLCGTGVGYSVQHKDITKLPLLSKPHNSAVYVIQDTIEGWADAFGELIGSFFGVNPYPIFDYSKIRAKGVPLKTSGGKAPGPDPLRLSLEKVAHLLNSLVDGADRPVKMKSIDVHDCICYMADAVMSGGIRRSACIALFDRHDDRMINCKSSSILITDLYKNGFNVYYTAAERKYKHSFNTIDEVNTFYERLSKEMEVKWYDIEPQRARANNSAVLDKKTVTKKEFYELLYKTRDSRSGEPGFAWTYMGLNPCAEISLLPFQFCNLTTINASLVFTQDDLNNFIKAAAFIGTLQASYTDFSYLRKEWRETTEKEALLGVSATGIASGDIELLDIEQAVNNAVEENKRVADLIGINRAARVTAIKPEGTTSPILGTSSGIHAYHAPYYIRRVRINKLESIHKYLKESAPNLIEDDYFNPMLESVLSVPIKAPEKAYFRNEGAMAMLERVKRFYNEWVVPGHFEGKTTNNVSCTINVQDHEWDDVIEWLWKNRDSYVAVSLLPYDTGTYKQQPFEECSKETYETLLSYCNDIDFRNIIEEEDNTVLTQEFACSGGACEVR